MKKILKYFGKQEWLFVGIGLFFIVIQVYLDLKLPDYMSEITTLVETKGSHMSDILLQGGYMLGCALGSMACSMIVVYFASRVAAKVAWTLRGKVYDHTLSFSSQEIDQFSTASLVNRTTNDITQVQTLISMGLQAIIKAPILAVWAICKIYSKSWQWTASTGVAVLILTFMLAMILIFAVPQFKKVQSLTNKINRISREQLSGIRVVRAYNAEDYQEDKFNQANDDLTRANLIANRVMALMSPSMTLINSGLTLAIYWIGAYMIHSAAFNLKLSVFSDMVVFSNYAMQVVMAFMLLNMIFILLPRAQVSAKRICEVIDMPLSILDGVREEETGEKGKIVFHDVSFRYPHASHDVLSHISFEVHQGETLAIIGATGSGKTSLINLMDRFYDVREGEILIDNVDVRAYKQESLHKKIGYVSQKAVLFSGTVESNVVMGDNPKEETNTTEALTISQSDLFVNDMEGQQQAHIAQGGQNVSGGQKQRLSIARAIARKPEILIFDDSFSALDYRTDAALRNALNTQVKETTKVIVAQRISTIRHATKILVLEHGRIAGCGTHEHLMETCSAYQEIARSQLSEEKLANETK